MKLCLNKGARQRKKNACQCCGERIHNPKRKFLPGHSLLNRQQVDQKNVPSKRMIIYAPRAQETVTV
jgi:uncharacterized membrane protein YvbJ